MDSSHGSGHAPMDTLSETGADACLSSGLLSGPSPPVLRPPPPPSGMPAAAVAAALGMSCDAAESFSVPTGAYGDHGGGVGAGGMVALGATGIPGCAPSDMAFLEEAVRDPLLESWICGDPLTGGPPLGMTTGGGAVSGGAAGADDGAHGAGGDGGSGGGRGGCSGGGGCGGGGGGAPQASAASTAAVAEAVALVDEGALKTPLAADEDHPWFFFDETPACSLDDADGLAPPTRDYGRLF